MITEVLNPKESSVWLGTSKGQIIRFNYLGHRTLLTENLGLEGISALCLSHDRKTIYACTYGGVLHNFDSRNGTCRWKVQETTDPVTNAMVKVSADDSMVRKLSLFGMIDNLLFVVKLLLSWTFVGVGERRIGLSQLL